MDSAATSMHLVITRPAPWRLASTRSSLAPLMSDRIPPRTGSEATSLLAAGDRAAHAHRRGRDAAPATSTGHPARTNRANPTTALVGKGRFLPTAVYSPSNAGTATKDTTQATTPKTRRTSRGYARVWTAFLESRTSADSLSAAARSARSREPVAYPASARPRTYGGKRRSTCRSLGSGMPLSTPDAILSEASRRAAGARVPATRKALVRGTPEASMAETARSHSSSRSGGQRGRSTVRPHAPCAVSLAALSTAG
jgi:hypothetical protein